MPRGEDELGDTYAVTEISFKNNRNLLFFVSFFAMPLYYIEGDHGGL